MGTPDLTLSLDCGHTVSAAGRADHPEALAGFAVRCPDCAGLSTVMTVGEVGRLMPRVLRSAVAATFG